MPAKKTGPPLTCYISYSHEDGTYAKGLASRLSREGILCQSDDVLRGGRSWAETVRAALVRADVLVVIATKRAWSSKSVQSEIEFFRDRRLPIIEVLFDYASVLVEGALWIKEDPAARRAGPSPSALRDIVSALREFAPGARASAIEPPLAEKRALNEGKMIFVGRGEVGKTSLVRALMGEKFRGDESKTQGINISNWPLQTGADRVRLNIWDFGGQEIMHATHQFFLTERSLYLLVLNGREGGEDLDAEYWLKHIESFGGESPVIVVQNKIAEHPFDLNYRGLRARYPQIREFVKTDCKTGLGIAALGEAIERTIADMPDVRMPFPADWFAVKEKLESMKAEYIGYDAFCQLCTDQGIENDSDRDALSFVLHCLGIALNYRDDSRLRETSVLKPEWVTEGIYKLLNARQLAERQGELHLEELQKLLPKDRYPQVKHPFLLELMRKFSLCFAFPDETDRYLIPELLGKEEPEETAAFAPHDCLNFEYHYGVLPEGLIPRFIVRSHTLSRGQARWRSGVVLAYEDCKALVTTVPAERRVVVRVKGGDAAARRRLLAIVRYDLDRINAEFKDRLDAQPKVPHPDFPLLAIDYAKLVALEKEGVTEFPEVVDRQVVKVSVGELLNGVDLEKQRETSLQVLVNAKPVFFSYSHKDESLRDELELHLKLLQRQGLISSWHDRKILAGAEWDHEIDRRLETARIILLLVSADFIASDYCYDIEVKRAMERHLAGKATVVPIVLRACDWKTAPFGKLEPLPKNAIPITLAKDRDAAWTEVAAGIRAIAEINPPSSARTS